MDFLDQHLCVYALFEYITIFITISIDQLKGTSSLCEVQSGGWSPWVLYLSGASVTYLWKKKQDVFIVPNFRKINTSSTVHWRLESWFWNVRHPEMWGISLSELVLFLQLICCGCSCAYICWLCFVAYYILLFPVWKIHTHIMPCLAAYRKLKGRERKDIVLFCVWLVEGGKEQRREVCLFTFGSGREKKGGLLTFTWFYFYAFKGKKCGSK